MSSMLPIIILSAVLPIVLIAVILGTLMKKQAATDKLIQTGVPARGRILQLGTTGQSVAVMGHRHLKLVLTVEVHPFQGAPYVATFEQLISELQIPSVQPGAEIDLRIDPTNPMKMALAGVVPPGMGQHPGGMGYPQQQAWGAQPVGKGPGGFGPAPIPMGVMQPNYKRSLPFIIFMVFITTVPITVIMLYTFVDFDDLLGRNKDDEGSSEDGDKKKKKGSVCERAAECCKVIGGDEKACSNVKLMPVDGCKQMLDANKEAAKSLGKSCD